ncbi:hypothetical protein B0T14DRAFT_566468 [Immersiella caudata]|uniref:Uncharacterized protein n=1 Tax=Immersiella caudata TaxID=314043 RepID=A0AA39WQD1_9PEZI|nr:hypothetical protein B0T14DRAFT_566468 [Immersiella caudata]
MTPTALEVTGKHTLAFAPEIFDALRENIDWLLDLKTLKLTCSLDTSNTKLIKAMRAMSKERRNLLFTSVKMQEEKK